MNLNRCFPALTYLELLGEIRDEPGEQLGPEWAGATPVERAAEKG